MAVLRTLVWYARDDFYVVWASLRNRLVKSEHSIPSELFTNSGSATQKIFVQYSRWGPPGGRTVKRRATDPWNFKVLVQ